MSIAGIANGEEAAAKARASVSNNDVIDKRIAVCKSAFSMLVVELKLTVRLPVAFESATESNGKVEEQGGLKPQFIPSKFMYKAKFVSCSTLLYQLFFS